MTSMPINALPLLIENRIRHKVWWVHPVLLIILLQPIRPLAYITIGYICFLALKDYLTMLPVHRMDRLSVLVGYLTIPLMIYWAASGQYDLFVIWVPLLSFLGIMLSLWVRKKRMWIRNTVRTLFFGLMVFLFGIGHLAVLIVTPHSFGTTLMAQGDILFLVVLVQFATLVSLIRNLFLRPFIDSNDYSFSTTIVVSILTGIFAVIVEPIFILIPARFAFLLGAIAGASLFVGQGWVTDLQNHLKIPEIKRIYPGYGGVLLQIAGYTITAPVYFTLLLLNT